MQKDILRKLLLDLLKIPSPSKSERTVAEFIKERFSELGLKTSIDEIGNVILEYDNNCESSPIFYVSHIDTVRPFFKPKAFDDIVLGRGAVDAKGPLLAMIDALYESKNPCIKVLGLVGEEDDSRGARFIAEKMKKLENVVIGEPSNNTICVGYRGRLLLEFQCKGANRHTASIEKKNPIHDITSIIMFLEKVIDSFGNNKIIGNPTMIVARSLSNVVPSAAKLTYDIRFTDETIALALIDRIKPFLKEECTFKQKTFLPPVEVKPSDLLVQALARSLAKEGISPRYIKKIGTSDMNVLFRVSSHIVSFGPGDPKLSHTLRERIRLNDMILASKVLRLLPLVYEQTVKSRAQT